MKLSGYFAHSLPLILAPLLMITTGVSNAADDTLSQTLDNLSETNKSVSEQVSKGEDLLDKAEEKLDSLTKKEDGDASQATAEATSNIDSSEISHKMDEAGQVTESAKTQATELTDQAQKNASAETEEAGLIDKIKSKFDDMTSSEKDGAMASGD